MIRLENREGISLIEVIVAMTLLGVVLTSLASATFQAARRSTTVAAEGYRQGVLMQEVNRLTALPWANLPTSTVCQTVSGGAFPHTRCVNPLSAPSSNSRRLRIIVTPMMPGARPDTIVVDRANPAVGNPLNVGS
jgi:prepilin-type N-terminal cleavage/methylation domain-containing protein